VFRTIAINSSGNDFSPFRDKISQGSDILIVDDQIGICTEAADFLSWKNLFSWRHVVVSSDSVEPVHLAGHYKEYKCGQINRDHAPSGRVGTA
jgi:hypothetical protein